MPNTWTPEKVLSLAPDDASRKNASQLAARRKWLSAQQHALDGTTVIWGECQGSGPEPYRCQVDIMEPAYKCTCPSRKTPCKHALGLFTLFAGQPKLFQIAPPPTWVAAWLAKRAEEADAKKKHSAASTNPARERASAQEKRAAGRDRKIHAGLDDLETWLHDLLRQGLAAAQSQPHPFWDAMVARLVDAQAPGLARLVRAMPGLAASGDGWHERLLDQIARLEMAITGYRRIQELPEDTQADLRAVIGFTIKQEDLKDQPGIHDTWLVLGRDVEEEAGLKTQRTWLWGRHTRRAALVLSFAAGKAILENSLPPGTAFLGDVVFYPGAYPLRGYVREQNGSVPLPDALPGCDTLTQVTAGYAAALAANPWLERYPLAINQVMPARDEDTWVLVDSDGRKLPLARSFLHGWSLMAYSGGQPLGVFGEWNGERLLPLSTWVDGQLFVFPARGG